MWWEEKKSQKKKKELGGIFFPVFSALIWLYDCKTYKTAKMLNLNKTQQYSPFPLWAYLSIYLISRWTQHGVTDVQYPKYRN